ncbi:replication-associated recombination protein A [Mycoplasmopsis verecunda]|nr:replication-associated recombination protein A [Mycoplasmopsis verecunda]WPB54251.1 replication-associated recombination protein A [Mycoplasmopsis verecunda]
MIKQNLANALRPETLNDIVGQKHVINLLNKVVKNKVTSSFLFFGEAGTGKTSTAIALANDLALKYDYFNASVDSKAKLVEILENNDCIIIDEIHRLNKDKQDILLSYLEFDKIIVYATTTENPYFRVVPAVRSRMQILQFHKISEADIVEKLRSIVNQNFSNLKITSAQLLALAKLSAGDLRSSINNLQMLATCVDENDEITDEVIKTVVPNVNFYSDLNSTAHYNNLSAFHKSLRGSDPNAALYYGMLILESGDIDGLFRRMLCVSYEDIGLASPNVSLRVAEAIRCYERLGLPEGKLPLGFAILDLALAPKSNSTYLALESASELIASGGIYQIPQHLRDSHYGSAVKLGDGIGYKYPHDFENNWTEQQYLPDEIKSKVFYWPQNNEHENKLLRYWNLIKKK